jgi:hypothetical protein
VAEDSIALPLSRSERQTIMEAVRAIPEVGPELAERLDAEWELDPATRMVVLQMQSLAVEIRTLRWWTLGIVVLAMVIQAGMVGLSVSLDLGGRSLQVSPEAATLPDQGPPLPAYHGLQDDSPLAPRPNL